MKKRNNLLKSAKDTTKLGLATMTGNLALGKIAAVPGMPAAGVNTLATISSGLNLLNIGQMGKNAMTITDMFSKNKCKKRK